MKPVIEVKQGKLQGEVQKTVLSGNEYYSFKGIPFAKPPVNELRFQVSEYQIEKITLHTVVYQ